MGNEQFCKWKDLIKQKQGVVTLEKQNLELLIKGTPGIKEA